MAQREILLLYLVVARLATHRSTTSKCRNLGDLVISLSNGSLCHLKPDSSGALAVVDEWHAHDYEPWIAAWNYHDINVIYSGRLYILLD